MPRSILVVDRHFADLYRERLTAAFPSLEVNAARDLEGARPFASRAEVICSMPRGVDEALVGSAKSLKWFQAGTAGTDFLTRMKTLKRDTLLTSTRGIHGPQMAEMALMLMLAQARGLAKCLANQREHRWDRPFQRRLFGKTVVVVGIGQSGEQLGLLCKALGMTVIGVSESRAEAPGFDRIVRRSDLVKVMPEAHFVVLVLPYDPSSHHIVNAEVLNAMRRDAYLVNIARGRVVDEAALIEALRAKRLAGAALDVFHTEPLPAQSPLWDMENVVVTPHAGGECEEYGELVLEVFENNLRCYLEGRVSDMRNLVRR